MFRSIRTKLAISYTGIVLLCLLLAGTGAVVLIARYQRESVLSRRRAVAATVTQQVQGLMALRVPLTDISALLTREAQRLGARFLLLGRDRTVLSDTVDDSPLLGQILRVPAQRLPRLGAGLTVVRYGVQDEGRYFLLLSPSL